MAGFENDVLLCKNINFDPAAAKPHLGIINAAGKFPIGTGATSPTPEMLAGSITSPLGTLSIGYSSPNITLDVSGGAQAVEHLTGNIGGQLNPDGSHNFNIVTANSTVKVAGSGSTLTEDFGITNLIMGTSAVGITSATFNVGVGFHALNALTSGQTNVGIGYNALLSNTTASANTAVGHNALALCSTNGGNTGVGLSSLTALIAAGVNNTAVGSSSLINLGSGSTNIAIGLSSGSTYTTTESSNIVIGSAGVILDNNVIRIGTQGTGTGQQSQTYIAGVINTVSGRVVKVTTPGAYPYLTLSTDYVILVDTSAARAINLIASPVTGTTYRIKDNVGSGAANNITITPNAGNIDGAGTFVINTNYGSVDIVYNGTQWNVV